MATAQTVTPRHGAPSCLSSSTRRADPGAIDVRLLTPAHVGHGGRLEVQALSPCEIALDGLEESAPAACPMVLDVERRLAVTTEDAVPGGPV